MSDLQDAIDTVEQLNSPIKAIREATDVVLEAARKYANGTEIRYCLWHERRAADNLIFTVSGLIVTRFCSSQDGSHDCVVETRLLVDVTEDTKLMGSDLLPRRPGTVAIDPPEDK